MILKGRPGAVARSVGAVVAMLGLVRKPYRKDLQESPGRRETLQ